MLGSFWAMSMRLRRLSTPPPLAPTHKVIRKTSAAKLRKLRRMSNYALPSCLFVNSLPSLRDCLVALLVLFCICPISDTTVVQYSQSPMQQICNVIVSSVQSKTYQFDPLRGIFSDYGSHGWFPSCWAAQYQSLSVKMPPGRQCFGFGQVYIIFL